jgi:hypothetical protein
VKLDWLRLLFLHQLWKSSIWPLDSNECWSKWFKERMKEWQNVCNIVVSGHWVWQHWSPEFKIQLCFHVCFWTEVKRKEKTPSETLIMLSSSQFDLPRVHCGVCPFYAPSSKHNIVQSNPLVFNLPVLDSHVDWCVNNARHRHAAPLFCALFLWLSLFERPRERRLEFNEQTRATVKPTFRFVSGLFLSLENLIEPAEHRSPIMTSSPQHCNRRSESNYLLYRCQWKSFSAGPMDNWQSASEFTQFRQLTRRNLSLGWITLSAIIWTACASLAKEYCGVSHLRKDSFESLIHT